MWTVRFKAISAVMNNYLDIINAFEQFTMAIINSSEQIAKTYSNKNTLLETNNLGIFYNNYIIVFSL